MHVENRPVEKKKRTTLWLRFRKNKGALVSMIVLLIILITTIFAPFFSTYDPGKTNLRGRLSPPSLAPMTEGAAPHILGTDQQGRDVYSRLVHGSRVTLNVGITVATFGAIIGIILGLLAGYFGGWTDMIIMRIVDIWASSPIFLISLTFVMVLGPGERSLIIAFLFNSWTLFCRMARSQAMAIRNSDMVESGRAIGAGTGRILGRHIMTNIISPLITTYVMEIAHYINAEANLSFLGFGVQPPATSWGLLIGEGRTYITSAWWIVLFPGLMIGITVLCLNLVGNWVREEFDPLSIKQ
ncbi:MAG: ABC transporter permease [Clostridia bacterium]|jgi:peptide/nickel transport system permease protein|nr:ABC transporter permease [Clostridia bacterium]